MEGSLQKKIVEKQSEIKTKYAARELNIKHR